MSFRIFYIEKTPLQHIKTKSSKSGKTDIFPKGLTHSFGPKLAIFPTFLFRLYRPGKFLFTIFQNRKTPFQAIKTRSSKSRKIDIFSNGLTYGFCLKMALLSTFIVYVIQAWKMSFRIFKNEKRLFQAIKTRSSKSRKSDIFPKGLTHSFGRKMTLFSTFFLCNIGQENVFYGILEQKKTLSRL